MTDYRKDILFILKKGGPILWSNLVTKFPDEAIDVDLPADIGYLIENEHIFWDDLGHDWLVEFRKDL